MQLQDYVNEVGDLIPTLNTLNVTSVYRLINKARRMLARETDATITIYPFSFNPTVQGYPLPTVNGCVMYFLMETYYYIGNLRQPIKGSLPQLMAGSDVMLNFIGWPLAYNTLNDNVLYWPIPGFAYSAFMKGKLDPIDITITSGQDGIIPYPYQSSVVFLAASYCALLDGNIDLSQAMMEEYRDHLRRLPKAFM